MAPDQWATFGASGVAVVGAVGGWLRFVRPRWRHLRARLDAGLESVAGRPAIVDPGSGRVVAPAVPGIGVRMANVEDTLTLLVSNQGRLDDHDRRIGKLEEAAVERIVTRADSALAWRAIRAVADNGGPDNVGGDHLDDEPDDYLDGTGEGAPGDNPRT